MTVFIAGLALMLAPTPANVAVSHGRVPIDHRPAVVAPYRARFERIARCESGSRWHIATGNGFFGGLQFTASSWRAVGGRGLPHWHSRLEQMYRAVRLMHAQGWNAWPVCAWR
jgi:hypothetical protein